MVLKSKTFKTRNDVVTATLEKHGSFYLVKIGEEIRYKSANELFAVQRFIEL